MTKHERLTYLLKAAATALHLSDVIEEDTSKEGPALRWHGLTFTPVDITRTATTLSGKKKVKEPGWILEYEVYYHGTREEPPDMDVIEITREVHEWAIVQAAVLHVIQERVSYVLGEAEETLLLEEAHTKEEATA